MSVQHTNRQGDLYHLHQGQTKTGKPKYWFSRKAPTQPVAAVPNGYEIYEAPDSAQVYLRKQQPTRILPQELQQVQQVQAAIRQLAQISHFRVEIEGDGLVVWLSDLAGDEGDAELDHLAALVLGSPLDRQRFRDSILSRRPYCRMLKFKLLDADRRLFAAERWCFRGSIDDWIHLSVPRSLYDLVQTYVPHLGRQSFYELGGPMDPTR